MTSLSFPHLFIFFSPSSSSSFFTLSPTTPSPLPILHTEVFSYHFYVNNSYFSCLLLSGIILHFHCWLDTSKTIRQLKNKAYSKSNLPSPPYKCSSPANICICVSTATLFLVIQLKSPPQSIKCQLLSAT